MLVTKSDRVRQLVASGQYKDALKIAKDFRLGITKEQSGAMRLAYECMIYGRFYKELGYNIPQKIENGVDVLKKLYGEKENAIC